MKTISGMLLTFLLGAMFVSLFHITTGMDMAHDMSDCPFMTHEEVICPMDFLDHIAAWKTAFLSSAPTLTTFLVFASVVLSVFLGHTHFFRKRRRFVPILIRQLRERTYRYYIRALQELFARGILNPKIFKSLPTIY